LLSCSLGIRAARPLAISIAPGIHAPSIPWALETITAPSSLKRRRRHHPCSSLQTALVTTRAVALPAARRRKFCQSGSTPKSGTHAASIGPWLTDQIRDLLNISAKYARAQGGIGKQ
jgi:hypothetical protein